jgi:nucleoside-diphosphate-sugar epimerase
MKIFVAGGTGAIGRPTLDQLLARGHHVIALTRTQERAQSLAAQGIEPAIADVFDAESVKAAITRAQPEVVIEQLTALPRTYSRESMNATAAINTRIRSEGGGNVLAAAKAAGVRRFLKQSMAFWGIPGAGLADESTPLSLDASPAVAADARLVLETERRLLQTPDLEGNRFTLWLLLRTWHMVQPRWRCSATGAAATVSNRRQWGWRLVVDPH